MYKYSAKLICKDQELIIGHYTENNPSVAIQLMCRTRVIRSVLLTANLDLSTSKKELDFYDVPTITMTKLIANVVERSIEFCRYPSDHCTNEEILKFLLNCVGSEVTMEEQSFIPSPGRILT